MKKRILIADDHDVVLAGLERIVSEHLGGAEFGEAENARLLLQNAWTERLGYAG